MNRKIDQIQINEVDDDEVEIDLLELFYFFKSKVVMILAGFIIGALLSGLVTQFLITPKYTAESKMYMVSASNNSVVDLSDLSIGQSLSKDYEQLIQTRPIYEAVIKKLHLSYDYEELLEMITISVVTDTRILTISCESEDPKEAMQIVNTLAKQAMNKLPDLMETSEPHIAEKAILPEKQSSPSLAKNTVIGALLGMILVMGVLTVQFLLDDTFQSAEDVEKLIGVMPLTVIPESDIAAISDKKEEEDKKKKGKKKHRFGKGRK